MDGDFLERFQIDVMEILSDSVGANVQSKGPSNLIRQCFNSK